MTTAIKGKIPTPNSWKPDLEKFIGITGGIALLEKQVGQTTVQDISKALDEYMRLYKAGIASKAEVLTLSRAFPDNEELSKACDGFAALPIVIGGPASVEMVDREGHLITTDALSKAFDRYMGNFRTRNTMVLHSDVQVGWALPAYISQGGQIFKSGVDGNGLFFITEIRDDTRIANKVMEQINDGKLRSYSIAGSATQVQTMMKGQVPYMQVNDLELAEVTVCEKGVNQGANFDLLKGCDCPTQSCADGSCLMKMGVGPDMIGHQTGQLSPDQVNYRESSEMEKDAGIMCGTCRFFNSGMSTCDLVTGSIMAGDWCSLFDPMDKSPVLENENNVREIMLMRKEDGDISFSGTFLNWMEKEETPIKKLIYSAGVGDVSDVRASDEDLVDPGRQRREKNMKQEVEKSLVKSADHSSPRKKSPMKITKTKKEDETPDGVIEESIEKAVPESLEALRKYNGGIATIANQGGRETEHHQLLREYGFPSEQPPESAIYVPVIETETDDWGCPINLMPPWTVNEAGQHLGETHPEDSPIHKMGVSKVLFSWLEKAGIWSPSGGGGFGGSSGPRRMRTRIDPGKHAAFGKPPRAKRGFRGF